MAHDERADVGDEGEPPPPREVLELPTGIPAFLGPTAWARGEAGEDLAMVPTPVGSLAELHHRFGPPHPDPIEMEMVENAAGAFTVTRCAVRAVPSRLLHWAVAHFFANGGRRCWIVSTGAHDAPVALGGEPGAPGLLEGLAALDRADEPDLVLAPDALALAPEEHAALARTLLARCAVPRRRFAVLDVREGLGPLDEPALAAARALFGEADLDRGAAYYPFLRTTWPPIVAEDEATGASNVRVNLVRASGETHVVDLLELRDGAERAALPPLPAAYDVARAAIAARRLVLPPSGAVAGVYAATDESHGVWKAPAGVALEQVEAPAVAIDAVAQERLNVDAATGRSINVVRGFPGRGTLLWGARTLAGNDNEWRYVPVRRYLAMLEESIDRSTHWTVYEPNEERTWTAVRALVENYLVKKWRCGALAGATPREAFYVRCGLGSTMTEEDVAAGRLILEVGVAVVRPAEFILLRIAHAIEPD